MIYWLSVYVLRVLARVYFRGRVFERYRLPRTGAYIGVINHQSHLDVVALTMVVNRRVHTMAKHSLFSIPVVRWWLRAVHMFPVRRETSDHRAFGHALTLLRAGEVLFMAPEGTRRRPGQQPPGRARTGFVLLAHLAGCPVVPVAVWGTGRALPPGARFPRPVRVALMVGAPIMLPPLPSGPERKRVLQEQADAVMREVYRMLEEIEQRMGRAQGE
ncbi:MAG: 1-acyl-sn-glycerol-3-phosphate acyltransferase [candidate division KSB1 bacterium]|nr:1-acyl-sn-glycerol-3-phosphate acyltransferase [candidate division KSB1 bacterium]MDZ7385005.1 1-acyl-sn-glycerol-3-phosphate acyltransferase [candidate division KSB1 bacterium]